MEAEATLPCWAFAPTTGVATTSCPGCVVMLGTTLDRSLGIAWPGVFHNVSLGWVLENGVSQTYNLTI